MIKKLHGCVKKYPWGGREYLPHLLDQNNELGEPWAEYWLGTHALGPSVIASDPSIELGQFLTGQGADPLPFMVKVLDVRDMLSIQLHPNLVQAQAGFDQEESKHVPLNAFERTYKDRNHKPELMVALSDFWLVQGFLKDDELQTSLRRVPSFAPLLAYLRSGIKSLYEYIMLADQAEINGMLKPLGKEIKPAFESGSLAKDDIDYWAAKAFLTFNRQGVCDRGIISLYLMNLLKLSPGQGIFQAPGILHAYLEGQNVECMANSDNVIRGGLTSKFVDRKSLLETVNYEMGHSDILTPQPNELGLNLYHTATKEFSLHVLTSKPGYFTCQRTLMLLALDGQYQIDGGKDRISLVRGESAIVVGPCQVRIEAQSVGQLVMVTAGDSEVS